jgi:hypothetical protein
MTMPDEQTGSAGTELRVSTTAQLNKGFTEKRRFRVQDHTTP